MKSGQDDRLIKRIERQKIQAMPGRCLFELLKHCRLFCIGLKHLKECHFIQNVCEHLTQ